MASREMTPCQVKELWNISEKDWLNLSNRWFLLAFFTHKKTQEGRAFMISSLKPSLGAIHKRGWYILGGGESQTFRHGGGGYQKRQKTFRTLLWTAPYWTFHSCNIIFQRHLLCKVNSLFKAFDVYKTLFYKKNLRQKIYVVCAKDNFKIYLFRGVLGNANYLLTSLLKSFVLKYVSKIWKHE